MWKKSMSLLTRIALLLLLVFYCSSSSAGYTQMQDETNQFITIPIRTWQTLTEECRTLNSELIICQTDLKRLKKPSAELLNELSEAEKMLKRLQEELTQSKQDLILLSKEVDESKTLLQKLKQDIDKERRIHRRQIWQNRIWCLIIGAGIGAVASR